MPPVPPSQEETLLFGHNSASANDSTSEDQYGYAADQQRVTSGEGRDHGAGGYGVGTVGGQQQQQEQDDEGRGSGVEGGLSGEGLNNRAAIDDVPTTIDSGSTIALEGKNSTTPNTTFVRRSEKRASVSPEPGAAVYSSTTPSTPGKGSRGRKDRVSEYEASCGRSPNKWGNEVKFHVKEKGRVDNGYSPISRFPNEVLMHTFSYLDPSSLSALSLVSRRFNALLTSPHAWRTAFARYFPAQTSRLSRRILEEIDTGISSVLDRRYFTRLQILSNWRKEYLLRTSLLRSLARGKAHVSSNFNTPNFTNANGGSIITYPGGTGGFSVTHISASFPPVHTNGSHSPSNSHHTPMRPHLLHASLDAIMFTSSDPTTGRIERSPPNVLIPEAPMFNQPAPIDYYLPGIEIGLGVMDLSEELGYVYGETVPAGRVWVNSFATPNSNNPSLGFGTFLDYPQSPFSICAVWIAKKKAGGSIFETTAAKCGVLVADSGGMISMYRLPETGRARGIENWQAAVKRWDVCPGIPILGIKVDEEYSLRRKRNRGNQFPIVVVNALGEIYYLKNMSGQGFGEWKLIEQSRRKIDLLSGVKPEEIEQIEQFKDHQRKSMDWKRSKLIWKGWAMDYCLEVDFAEANVIVIKKKAFFDEDKGRLVDTGRLIRYHLVRKPAPGIVDPAIFIQGFSIPNTKEKNGESRSIFGGNDSPVSNEEKALLSSPDTDPSTPMSPEGLADDVWQVAELSFAEERHTHKFEITAMGLDMSNPALLSPEEDPLNQSQNQSPDIPGFRARLFSVGTSSGTIFIWNIRGSATPSSTQSSPPIEPLRIIHTESPQISTLALSSLYLVHGGNDGLVQCWDPLSSMLAPARTIHSRFSSRARRRIAQVEYNNLGLGDNQFAARAAVLDPDPTVLRGCVALGTYIRYWSFAGDQWSSGAGRRKKKAARGGRRSAAGEGIPNRPTMKQLYGDIHDEKRFLDKERMEKKKEAERLQGRYGIVKGGDGLNEEEMLAYAKLLSEEAWEVEKIGRGLSDEGGTESIDSFTTATGEDVEAMDVSDPSYIGHHQHAQATSDLDCTETALDDPDVAEAIRLSLLDSDTGRSTGGVSYRYEYRDLGPNESLPGGNSSSSRLSSSQINPQAHPPPQLQATAPFPPLSSTATDEEWPSPRHAAIISPPTPPPGYLEKERELLRRWGRHREEVPEVEDESFEDDLEFAIRLSLAEEESKRLTGGSGSAGSAGGAGSSSKSHWMEQDEGGSKGKGKGKG